MGEKLKNITWLDQVVTIKSAMNKENEKQLDLMAQKLLK